MSDSEETRWFHNPILLILAFVVFPPLGLYGLFRLMELSPLISVLLVILVGSAGGQYSKYGFDVTAEVESENDNTDSVAVSKPDAVEAPPTDAAKVEIDSASQ